MALLYKTRQLFINEECSNSKTLIEEKQFCQLAQSAIMGMILRDKGVKLEPGNGMRRILGTCRNGVVVTPAYFCWWMTTLAWVSSNISKETVPHSPGEFYFFLFHWRNHSHFMRGPEQGECVQHSVSTFIISLLGSPTGNLHTMFSGSVKGLQLDR